MAEPIVTGEEMRDAERAAIGGGTSVDTLMRRAGEGAADWIWRMSAGRSATVLCGPGNNGGDGYVIARRLRELGAKVSVVAPLAPKTDAARSARAEWGDPVSEEWSEEGGDVFVDALFGTGLSRGLSAELQQLVHRLANRHGLSVAVDLPSGVSSDDGALFDDIPSYDLALALGALKPAHFLLPAAAHIGSLRTVDIGLGDIRHRAETLDRPQIEAPRADAHKYSRGLALVVGGAMPGASLLAARAAQGAGAGFVQLASDETAAVPHDIVQVDGDLEHALSDERIDAALVGPGLGRDQDASRRLQRALAAGIPLVIDGDALRLITPSATRFEREWDDNILTPHEGELEALEEHGGIEARGSKLDRARRVADTYGAIVIAKGPDTVIASPDGHCVCAPRAPSWLSVAGSGDVLAGIALARRAVSEDPDAFDAACDAVWLHAEAARLAGPSFAAGELADRVSAALGSALAVAR